MQTRLMLMLAVLLAVQPALHGIWWPLRVARDSQREVCTRIDALVPADQRLYVLGGHEYPDTQLYSQRQFEFVDSIDAALHSSSADRAYAILRADEAVDLTAGASVSHSVIFEFERAGKRSVLIEITGRREK